MLAVWIAREPVRARSLAHNDGGGKASCVIYEERKSVVAFLQGEHLNSHKDRWKGEATAAFGADPVRARSRIRVEPV